MDVDAAPIVVDGKKEVNQELAQAVRQIEFYFADSNLPYDKFMWTLHTKSPEHWVPIATVASFKRMRAYIEKNGLPWLVEGLRGSTLLETDEKGENVRRRTEVKEPTSQFERSIYVKGFPDETPDLQQKIEDFFGKYAATNAVRMRRMDDKAFKNSVFVEFTEPSGVDVFLLADPKPTWEGKELVMMTKEEYCDMKIKEKGLSGKAATIRKDLITKHKFDAFKLSSSSNGSTPVPKTLFLDFMGTKLSISPEGTVDPTAVPYTAKSSLRFSFTPAEGEEANINFMDIKNPLKDLFEGRAPYIQYTHGETSGLVGFHKALSDDEINTVKDALKETAGKKPLTWESVAEEEEKKFQVDRAQTAARSALRRSQEDGNSRGGRGGRGGRGRGGGRGGGRDSRGRGRGRGRGGHRDRDGGKGEGELTGEKRKRAVEPDGGPDVGVRGGAGVPTIGVKVAKVE